MIYWEFKLFRAESLKEESKTFPLPFPEAVSFDWANAPASGADGVSGWRIRSLREQNWSQSECTYFTLATIICGARAPYRPFGQVYESGFA